MGDDPKRAGANRPAGDPTRHSPSGADRASGNARLESPAGVDRAGGDPTRENPAGADRVGEHPTRHGPGTSDRVREWALLGEWLGSPPPVPPLRDVDLAELHGCVRLLGRTRGSLAALEAELVSEIARRDGDAAAEEVLRREQKRSRSGARKAVKTAAQLEWAPGVADKLAEGAITPEAAGLILDAAAEGPVDQRQMLAAAEEEPDDRFRRTLKEHINERTSEQELNERRASAAPSPSRFHQRTARRHVPPVRPTRPPHRQPGARRAGRQSRRPVPQRGSQAALDPTAAVRRRPRRPRLHQRRHRDPWWRRC